MLISEALARYVTQLEADGRSVHTVGQVKRHVLRLVAGIGEVAIEDLRHEDLALFLASDLATRCTNGAARKPTSTNALRSSLRTFMSFCHAAGYSQANAGRLIRRARCSTPKPRGLSNNEIERLVSALDTASTQAEKRDRAMFRTMLDLGLRVGSTAALRVEDLDLNDATLDLRVLKNGDSDRLYLPHDLIGVLHEHVGDRRTGALFARADGARLGTRQIARRLEGWSHRAGIGRRIHPHELRHAFAMRAYERTGDVLLVARLLCHRNLGSTAIYARPSEAAVRAAVAVG